MTSSLRKMNRGRAKKVSKSTIIIFPLVINNGFQTKVRVC